MSRSIAERRAIPALTHAEPPEAHSAEGYSRSTCTISHDRRALAAGLDLLRAELDARVNVALIR